MTMLGRRGKQRVGRRAKAALVLLEPLEARQLLSAAALSAAADAARNQLHPNAVFLHRQDSPAGTTAAPGALPAAATIPGYTPDQVRHGYGFDALAFGNGTIPADGRGQTIAIVDAYQDPNIVADLGVFDAQFNLPAPPGFQIVNQRGGGQLPSSSGATAAGWAGETSLDVEWAHAVAPQANILLVETDSDSMADLFAGVDFARRAPGVSVVSMSFGGSEFFPWSPGNETSSETQFDDTFTTPAGHAGVTFVAAAGDSGASQGALYPAASPNVVSVGGTTLNLAADGTYVGEQSWDGTSGGNSVVEPEPPYQSAAQVSGARSSPDVSYDGNPDTGFAVYDSVPSQGQVGWQQVGGTSAGAPQWAALIAIANQGRQLAGLDPLDGASQTLPLLYGPYAVPDTAGYAAYAGTYHDVTDTGPADVIHWRWGGTGGGSSNPATAGFDTATGLGSPVVPQVVSALVGSPTSTPTPTPTPTPVPTPTPGPTPTPTPSPSPSPQQLPASPIFADFLTAPPAAVRGGAAGTAKLLLSNTSGQRFSGPVDVALYASPDNSAADGTSVAHFTISRLTLRDAGSKKFTLKFNYPGQIDGTYFLIVSVDASKGATQTSQAVSATPVAIAKPFVDLATGFAGLGDQTSVAVFPGTRDSLLVTLKNQGNVAASGAVTINLYQAPGQTLDVNADTVLGGLSGKRINLRPGQSKTFRIRFVDPQDPAGTYNLIAAATFTGQFADSNPSNDLAVIGTM